MNLRLSAPQPLTPDHSTEAFDCGEPSLNDWLKRRALANQISGASRTFVLSDHTGVVAAYYALAAGSVSHSDATRKVRRNMPEPIPVMVLARLAVELRMQGQNLGPALLKDAVSRVLYVSEHAGIRAILVHAINSHAKNFYEHYGFQPSPIHPLTLLLPLQPAN